MHLSDVLQPLRKEVAVVLYGRIVLLKRRAEDISTFQRIQAGLGQVIIHQAGADRGSVRSAEDIEGFHLLGSAWDAVQNPEVRTVTPEGDHTPGAAPAPGKPS